ncbi:MAG: hypothetical protein R6X22_05415 [Gemmatimonadota bacterium]
MTRRLTLALSLVVFATSCADTEELLAPTTSLSSQAHADPPIERWTIRPDLTDPGIDVGLDDYIIRVPARGRNGRLFMFLPGSRVGPGTGEVVQAEAARLGYLVIGLSYPNDPGLVSFCGPAPDPDACYETTRLEGITGEDVSSFVTIDRANSIDNRLTRLLEYLAANRPGDGWSQFLAGGEPKWAHIAVGGVSQGAGYAAMLAKMRRIDRAVMLSGVTDAIGGVAAAWVTPGVTPPGRLYGLVHQQDNQFRPGVLANWVALGMDAFGGPVVPEASVPPYDGARMLITNVTPSNGSFAAPFPHASTGVDPFTPFTADGVPVLRPAWRYMLGYCPPPGRWDEGAGAGPAPVVPCQTDH